MKKITILLLSGLILLACNKSSKKSDYKNAGAMAHSVGRINELSVVIESDLWKGSLGDTIRKYFGAEVPGLPQEEPLFSMRQIPPKAFSGIARKNRIFLKIEKGEKAAVNYLQNKYATPQLGAVLAGTSEAQIATLIRENVEKITNKLKDTETLEKQRRIKKSLEKIPQLKEKFGITLDIPSAYRVAKDEENFMWIRKDIPNGDMNLIIYELPFTAISQDTNTISQIIKIRDSIGALKIPTDTGKFMTEEAYAPYLFENELDGKYAYEIKGTWEIKDRYMAGPFVNFMIKDEKNNRLLVLEGFILAPSVRKRDNMFELEAIMKTVEFQ